MGLGGIAGGFLFNPGSLESQAATLLGGGRSGPQALTPRSPFSELGLSFPGCAVTLEVPLNVVSEPPDSLPR